MFHVQKPAAFSAPGSCVVLPGRTADPHGFIDTTTELEGAHGPLRIYISVTGVRRIAQQFPEQTGLVPAERLADAQAEADALREQLAAAEAEVERLRVRDERIAGLALDGFDVVKRKGPTPQKVMS